MAIVEVKEELKKSLKQSGFSAGILDNCLNSKFLAIEKIDSRIIGVCFVGGSFNNQGIEIIKEFRGKGLSKKLLSEMVEECKKRNIPFLTGAFKPTNVASIKAHMKIGYKLVFTFHYNQLEGKEIVVICPFNKKGQVFVKFCSVFNTKIGNAIFAIFLKSSRPVLRNLLAFSENLVPKVDLLYSIRNFEKVESTLNEVNFRIEK